SISSTAVAHSFGTFRSAAGFPVQLLRDNPTIDFMGRRRAAMILSAILIVVSIGAIVVRGFNWGLEFTGGIVAELMFENAVELESVRGTLADAGFDQALVQSFGTTSEVLVRLPPVETADEADLVVDRVLEVLRAAGNEVRLMRPPEFIGSQVGSDLAEQGALAMLFATIMIFVYVM